MYRSKSFIANDPVGKDVTHVEILDIGDTILDEKQIRFEEEKQRAVAEAQLLTAEKVKRKYEREIQKKLDECIAQHKAEVGQLLLNTEERVQEEVAKREANLQAQMAESVRNLQNKMSREMQEALEDLRRKHELEMVAEVQKTVSIKEKEMAAAIVNTKKVAEEKKKALRLELEEVSAVKIVEVEQRAEAKRLKSLEDQEAKFKSQMTAVLQELQMKHSEEIFQLRQLISQREDYIVKLHKAVDFLRLSRQELIEVTLDVHEQMKYFIDRTQPFTEGQAQFLVPRLDLTRFSAEPDTESPY